MEMFKGIEIAKAVEQDLTSALFVTLRNLPLGIIVSLIATILIVTFFITSADSATFVLGMMSSKGDNNPKNKVKFIWGILQSAIAIILLFKWGGTKRIRDNVNFGSTTFCIYSFNNVCFLP